MKHISCGSSIRSVGLAVVIGLAGGCLIGVALLLYFAADSGWRRVAGPSDSAAKVLGYYYAGETIYIRTIAGDIYACSSSTSRTKNEGCTKLTQVPSESNINISCDWQHFPTPKPPGTIVHELEVHPCVPDSTLQVNHIVLEDGSIWEWKKLTSEFKDFFKVIFLVVCSIIGVILGVICGIIRLLVKRKRQLQPA